MTQGASAATDGWISATLEEGIDVHVHLGRAKDGSIVITDLLVSAAEITTDTLRRVNPNRVLAGVDLDLAGIQRAIGVAEAQGIEPTRGQVAAVEGASSGRPLGWLEGLVAEMESDDTTRIGDLRRRATRLRPRRRRPLGRPDNSGDDAFYRRVADAYRSASAETGRPAVLLADENAVPVETVRRWVKEARRRGFLAAGRKGRAL